MGKRSPHKGNKEKHKEEETLAAVDVDTDKTNPASTTFEITPDVEIAHKLFSEGCYKDALSFCDKGLASSDITSYSELIKSLRVCRCQCLRKLEDFDALIRCILLVSS